MRALRVLVRFARWAQSRSYLVDRLLDAEARAAELELRAEELDQDRRRLEADLSRLVEQLQEGGIEA